MLEISRLRRIDPEAFAVLLTRIGRLADAQAAASIVIKPNLTAGSRPAAADPDKHIVSDLGLVRDVVAAALTVNPRAIVYIAESDGIGNDLAYLKFANLGLPGCLDLDDEQSRRVALLDLSRDRLVRVTDPAFRYFTNERRQLWLSETLMRAGLVISLSNSKTHTRALFSGACKNLFGCLPASDKSVYHPSIHEVIHDLTIAVGPRLNIVDAFFAMEGHGPILGCPVDCGYRVIADDAAEADACAAQSAGLNADEIEYLRYLLPAGARTGGGAALRHYPVIVPLAPPAPVHRALSTVGSVLQSHGIGLQAYGDRLAASRTILEGVHVAVRPLASLVKRATKRPSSR